eukprot:365398-Chlamydomonas_euryale.AAC.2
MVASDREKISSTRSRWGGPGNRHEVSAEGSVPHGPLAEAGGKLSWHAHLHSACAKHHVQSLGAHFGHVAFHELVALLWHDWDVIDRPLGVKAQPNELKAELLADGLALRV